MFLAGLVGQRRLPQGLIGCTAPAAMFLPGAQELPWYLVHTGWNLLQWLVLTEDFTNVGKRSKKRFSVRQNQMSFSKRSKVDSIVAHILNLQHVWEHLSSLSHSFRCCHCPMWPSSWSQAVRCWFFLLSDDDDDEGCFVCRSSSCVTLSGSECPSTGSTSWTTNTGSRTWSGSRSWRFWETSSCWTSIKNNVISWSAREGLDGTKCFSTTLVLCYLQ